MLADVVAIGEGLLRLSPVGAPSFAQTDLVRTYIGGSEVNVLVGLARLGHRGLWLSRVTQNALGDRMISEVASQGVDTSSVVRTPEGRVGCYWLEGGEEARDVRITYDRSGSAMTKLRPVDLPRDLFIQSSAAILHTTGITMALSTKTRTTVLEAVKRAKRAGWRISFDTNFRPQLWLPDRAREVYSQVLALADIAFVPHSDLELVLGSRQKEPIDARLQDLATSYPGTTFVVTVGARGAYAITTGGRIFVQPSMPARAVDRIGRGDAFVAGFLHAVVELGLGDAEVERGLAWGAAMAALKFGVAGDLPLVERGAVEALARNAVGTDADC